MVLRTMVLSILLFLLAGPAITESHEMESDETRSRSQDSSMGPASAVRDEIVVTARRREEDAREVPISVTVFSGSALEERSILDLGDVADFAPNVDFSSFGDFSDQASEAAVVIRGIGQLDTALFADPGVAIYLDGVYLGQAHGGVADVFEVERVEILRGPQGTLFGKNTTGGVVSLITKKPATTFGGRAAASIGSFDRADARLSVSGPLSETLFGKLIASSLNRGGFSRSLWDGQSFHDVNRETGRLAFSFQPSEGLSLDFSADLSRARESGGNQILLSRFDTPLMNFYNRSLAAARLPLYDDRWLTGNLRESFASFPTYHEGEDYGVSLNLTRAGRRLLLRSITAFRGFDYSNAGEHDASPLPASERVRRQEQEQLSQEIQLSGTAAGDRLTWMAGAFYFREQPREVQELTIMDNLFDALEAAPGAIVSPPGVPASFCNPGPPPPGVPCFGGPGNPLNFAFFNGFGGDSFIHLDTTSYALYGHGTYQVTDRLSTSFGLRYSRDDKRFDYLNINNFGVVDSDLFNEGDWDAWTPHISLTYQAWPETILYLSASRGYKSGGFNGRPQQRQVLDPYDPENVWTYDLGIKGTSWNRRLIYSGSAFFSEYDDIQFFAVADVNAQPVFVLQNAGAAEIKGFELEVEATLGAGWAISAAVGHLDTELTKLNPLVEPGLEVGNELPKSPRWTYSGAVQYAFSLADRGSMIVRTDYSYRSRVWNDVLNSPGIVQEGYGLLSTRLSYSTRSNRWEIALYGTNLTDEGYLERAVFGSAFGVHIGIAGRPREWGLTAQLRF